MIGKRRLEDRKVAQVLYIDDDAQNRLLVRRVLEVEGYIVLEAEDGPAGLELAADRNPDLILLDINLPGIDGYEIASRLKEDERTRHIPVVAMTADVLRGARERARHAGFDGYISKPIDVDLLPDQIGCFLRGREWE
jgi:two-component system cell cycle response regulator DivK